MRRSLRNALAVVALGLAGCDAAVTTEAPPAPGAWPQGAVRHDELRPDTPGSGEPGPKFAAGEVVSRFDVPDAAVVVHFSRAGANQVPALDVDDAGVPDFVEVVGATYRDVLARYHGEWGFRAPPDDLLVPQDNGGDGRLDVYLVDFAGRADGAYRRECLGDAGPCPGHVAQENDFQGYAYPSPLVGVRVVSSHEYFHAVQAGYDRRDFATLHEGTAVWATERFDPALDDLEAFAPAYLAQPERSLDQEPTGPVEAYIYGAGLFFECLAAGRGDDAVKELFESLDGTSPWLRSLARSVARDGGTLERELERCADWNLFTGTRAVTGYGHRRPQRLGLAPVTTAALTLEQPRVRLFRAASRYYQLTGGGPDAVVYWNTTADAIDGGAGFLRVRTARVDGGAPRFTPVPRATVTPIGAGSTWVLTTHVTEGQPSVTFTLCAGAPSDVDRCRASPVVDAGIDGGSDAGPEPMGDAGQPDAGTEADAGQEPPPPPQGCGCGTGALGAWPLALVLGLAARRRRARWTGLLALSGSVALAQGVEPADAGVPEPLLKRELTTVVTGSRLAERTSDATVATEVITRRQIQETGARTVTELFQSRAGLETMSNVGSTALRMQGLGPEYSLVLIDGQRAAGRINGGIDLGRISVEDIEQIEIIKGPSSVLWGSEALAGTINIITRKSRKRLGGSVTASYGTLNQADVQATAEATTGYFGVGITGGFKRRDAYDLDPADVATNGSAFDQGQAALSVTFGQTSKRGPNAELHLDFTRRSQAAIDASATGAVFDRTSRDNVLDARLTGRLPAGRGSVSATVGASMFDRRFIVDQRGSNALDEVQDTFDGNLQLQAQADQALGEQHVGLVGGELLIEQLRSTRLVGGEGRRLRGALFLQDTWSPLSESRLSIAGGARVDVDSLFGSAVTPRVSARFTPSPALTLRLSTGLGFRAPSFQELLLQFENASAGYVVVGNPNLRPERSFGTTFSGELRPAADWLVTLGLFWNELWDMIGYEALTGGSTMRFQTTNLARARTRGGELSVAWATPYKPLSLEAGYTLTDSFDLTQRLPLDGQALHRWFGQTRFRERDWGLTALVRFSVTSGRPFSVDEVTTQWTEPFAMLDARVAKTLGTHLELFVAGQNLLGAGSAADLPIPPRSIFGGLTLHD